MKNKKPVRRKNKMSKTHKNKKTKNATKKIGGSTNSQNNSASENSNKPVNSNENKTDNNSEYRYRLRKEFGPDTLKGKAAKIATSLTLTQQEKVGRTIKLAKRSVPALLIVGAIGGLVAILANQ